MGKLGFLFGDKNEGIVIFVEKESIKGDIIIGEFSRLSKCCDFYFLKKDLSVSNHMVFDDAKFKYVKICLAQKTQVDFENLLVWFETRKYREIRQIFEEDLGNLDLKILTKKVINLLGYF